MTRIAEIADRLRRLAKRREMEGIYTDSGLCEEAAAILAAIGTGGQAVAAVAADQVFDAVLSCSHSIDAQSVILKTAYDKPGNALKQLHDRITAALSQPHPADERVVEALETYYARQIEWSKQTFGPALRTGGVIDHIRKELKEIEADPHDLSEWVDVIILAMDGFWRHGGGASDLMPALLAKQQKNMARTWPDWRTMSENSAIEHDRSGETALTARGGPVDG